MSKPELVLSNTTTFFGGRIEAVFQKAKQYGFKYVELVPYRWVDPQQAYELSQKYGIEIAGIHLPEWWAKKSLLAILRDRSSLLEKIFDLLWWFYLGAASNNPGLNLTDILLVQKQNPVPYLLFHADVVHELGKAFDKLTRRFPIVIENVLYYKKVPEFFWDPLKIRQYLDDRGLRAGLTFDPGHYQYARAQLPSLNLLHTYRKISPEVIHISFDHFPSVHGLPNQQEQKELVQMLQIHAPNYLVLETNPFLSIKKGKKLLEKIINQAV